MPPQRKSALTAEQQLVKSNLPPQSKKKAVALSEGNSFSPSKFTSAPEETFQQSCRVPEHSIHDKAVLKRPRSSFWPFSKLQNAVEKTYFKAVTLCSSCWNSERRQKTESSKHSHYLQENKKQHYHSPLQTITSQERSYHINKAAS